MFTAEVRVGRLIEARIVREAKNPDRRVFLVPLEAEAFLGEVLTTSERMRLARFLRGDRADLPPSSRSRF